MSKRIKERKRIELTQKILAKEKSRVPSPQIREERITKEDIHNQAIQYSFRTNRTQYQNCTGLLIHPRIIITAAHCARHEDNEEDLTRFLSMRTFGGININTH